MFIVEIINNYLDLKNNRFVTDLDRRDISNELVGKFILLQSPSIEIEIDDFGIMDCVNGVEIDYKISLIEYLK
jgi:hypothetical protein